ncbi:hypothetical protein ADL15_26565 [Actinoplanes awajinensis subsp. mycoplanecinus]|uniref:histidine kinase n=1 Tax=Actinoplanes awajinensis subsp. mycoplanecinus TaxID=135947 RepID=A0A101JMM7_9ACTN|nr:hypothetical protein ADL15_26565 [Actinoplanes awajinensis subsp. mycoplanecinus]
MRRPVGTGHVHLIIVVEGCPLSSYARAHRRLTRQSLLVTAACVTFDVLAFVVQDLPVGGWRWMVVLLAVIAADAALATPTRYSGLVAVAAVGVNVGGAVLLGGPRSLGLNETGVLVASFRAGAWLRGGFAVGSLVVVVLGLVIAHLVRGYAFDWHVVVAALKIGMVSWLVGRYTTARRRHLDELRKRTELEERDAREAVERAVAEDRAATARDLHDVITHHVSAISVHAGAARLRFARAGADDAALGSLRSVEQASRSALGDLRHMLDVLHGQRSAADEQPGLDRIDELLHGFRTAGMAARCTITGTPFGLPQTLDGALYRIVQEMLTNALRHGDGSTIEVAVRYRAHTVEVETINPYRPPAGAHGQGRGLSGIRERTEAFGGRMISGPQPDGRHWSTAVIIDLEDSR